MADEKKPEEPENWQEKTEEYLNGWKRAQADLINYKKDEAKRFHEVIKFANEALIKDLLNVLDSFDLALATAGETDKSAEKSVYLIRNQLMNILKENGLETVTAVVGQRFDPASQEAIAVTESDREPGTIIEVMGNGYLLNGKLIRPAKVKVSK